MGWASKRNGELLTLAESQFDIFLTVDRNLSFQQNVNRFKIAVVVMAAKGNRYSDLQPLVPRILTIVETVEPGQVVRVSA